MKTRRQLSANRSLYNVTLDVYRDAGIVGFYRGLLPRVLRRSFSNALSWMLFEQIVSLYKGFTGL
jgi:hypothetical protein